MDCDRRHCQYLKFSPNEECNTASGRSVAIHKACRAALLLFLAVLIEAPAFASKASEETIAAFKAVIEAVKKVEHPLTGRGSAISEVYDRHPTIGASKKMVDFVFKGDMSRSTRFSMKEGKRDKPEVVWAMGKEHAVVHNYSTNYASIQHTPGGQFHRQRYNLNPKAFMEYHTRQPLEVYLQRVLDGPATLSTMTDSNGILHLIADYKDPNTHQHSVVFVDPAKGYRLVGGLGINQRFDRPDRTHTDFLDIHWHKYESCWYIKASTYTSYTGVHSLQERPSLGREGLIRRTAITITQFHPNDEVSDLEFTLEGLGLPDGTFVMDRISGTKYRLE